MKVELINYENKKEQNIDISSIDIVSTFLTEIYKELKPLDNDCYYCILFKYINKYNKKVHAKLGYIYKKPNCCEQFVLKCDENYLKYYIKQLQLTKLEIEYKMCKGEIFKVGVSYKIEVTRCIDNELPKKLELFPEQKISYDYRFQEINYYNFYKLKMIKYTNLKNIECTIDLKEENINIPISEMIKKYEINIFNEITFYWIVDKNSDEYENFFKHRTN